jgi:hypothetical protein
MLICRDAYFVAAFAWAELSIGLVAWRGFFEIGQVAIHIYRDGYGGFQV